jgi:Protein of unknown function (DUF2735)
MINKSQGKSAKVLQFPVRDLALSASETTAVVLQTDHNCQPLPMTACGSGWYHDEAVRNGDDAHKH